jgi:AraC-like DNA-binding protein
MSQKEIEILESMPFVRHVSMVDGETVYYHVPRRLIYDFEIIFITEGSMRVELENRHYDIHKYDLHIMPPLLKHTRKVLETPTKYYNFHFDFLKKSNDDFTVQEAYLNPIEAGVDEAPVIERLVNRDIYFLKNIKIPELIQIKNPQTMITAMRTCFELFKSPAAYRKLQLGGMFNYIIGLILEEIMLSPEYTGGINAAIEEFARYVDKYYYLEIEIEGIVRTYNFSGAHFRRRFAERYGVSPKEYLSGVRFNKAKELLKTSDLRVCDIAHMTGYPDPIYFSRIFKKNVGVYPTEYKKKDR